MKITNPITLDVARSNSYICLLGKQFDSNSRYLQVTLTNNGQPLPIPSGAGVVLRATRADGAGSMTAGTVNGDGTALVEIDETVLEVAGAASLSIEVTSGGQVLTSASCNLTVQKADASGWVKVYVAAASVSAGTYHISLAGQSYSFTTTQAIPAGGAIYFSSDGGTAQTRDASGNVLDASLTLTAGTSGTELTSDVPTMSFLTAIAGRMATIEAEMSQKADIDGSYPLLHAGTADNLMADTGATQAIPFIQEGTGKGNGEATVKAGGVLQLKKKLGNTVCVNQLVDTATTSVTIPSGHKYYAVINGTASIGTSNGTAIAVTGGQDIIIDLSLWFGSTDRIPSDLLSHTENWGRYYAGSLAYAAGYLDSADGTVMRSIGRNVWDEEWEYGSISSSTGQNDDSSPTAWRTKNYIPIIPNSSYYITASVSSKNCKARFYDAAKNYIGYQSVDGYNIYTKTAFTVPVNAYFMRLSPSVADVPTPNNNITISLYYSGESGYDEYYPYSVLAEIDTGSEVLRSAGAVADEKTSDGTITRRVGYVDLGTLTYITNQTGTNTYEATCAPVGKANGISNFICAGIAYTAYADDGQYGIRGYSSSGQVAVRVPKNVASTTSAIKTALSGVYLYYELATPATEQGTAFAENIPCDPDGTLNWTQSAGVPQGNEIFYPADLKGALESIVAALPSANGTYTLHATVTTAGVTFSWS